jgi:hypothetical protein
MAWYMPQLRRVLLEAPWRRIVLPWSLFIVALAAGLATSLGLTSYSFKSYSLYTITDWRNPLPVVAWAFFLWNAFHFGAQLYGVSRLYGIGKSCALFKYGIVAIVMIYLIIFAAPYWVRSALQPAALALYNSTGIVLYFPKYWEVLILVGLFSWGHWLTEIGLCSAVVQRRWWIPALLVIGCAGFLWKGPDAVRSLTRWTPSFWGMWFGLGFVHFTTLVWKHDRAVALLPRVTPSRATTTAAPQPYHRTG